LKPFSTIAFPVILTPIATPFSNHVLTISISAYGDSAVAAWAVVSRLKMVTFGKIFALSGVIIRISFKILVTL
jgi:Na+-driven multidrug efflux pump